MEKDKVKSYLIPENYEDGIALFSSVHEYKEVFAAVFIALISVLGILSFLSGISKTAKLSVSITAGFSIFALCLIHLNGNNLLTYIKLIIRFIIRKKRYYYNPRIKKEDSSKFFLQEMMICTSPISEKTKQSHHDEKTVMYFKEDKNFVEMPYDYMNIIQRIKYEKSNKGKRE